MSGAHGVARQFASKLQLRAQTAHILDFTLLLFAVFLPLLPLDQPQARSSGTSGSL